MNLRIARGIERLALLSAVAVALGALVAAGARRCSPTVVAVVAASMVGRAGRPAPGGRATGASRGCSAFPAVAPRLIPAATFLWRRPVRAGSGSARRSGCSDAVPVPWSRVPDLCLRRATAGSAGPRRGRGRRGAGGTGGGGLLVSSPLLRRHRQPRHVQRHGDARDLPGGAVGLPAVGGKSRAVSVLRSSATRVRLHRQRLSMRDGRRRRTGRRGREGGTGGRAARAGKAAQADRAAQVEAGARVAAAFRARTPRRSRNVTRGRTAIRCSWTTRNCACDGLGCCARFARCADGDRARCTGGAIACDALTPSASCRTSSATRRVATRAACG